MPRHIQATAPGKLILTGEHAVVYGAPAIAVPVTEIGATARFTPNRRADRLTIELPDIGQRLPYDPDNASHPVVAAITGLLTYLDRDLPPGGTLRIRSTIPVAAGLGSGAAVSVALIRALARALRHDLSPNVVSALAFEVEKLHHGTPSGIDNTVIAHNRPVLYLKDQPLELLTVGAPIHLVIADTGIAAQTKVAVGGVRARWQADPDRYNRWFDDIAELSRAAANHIELGQVDQLGPILTDNHRLLQAIGVSCPELDALVDAARQGGALGAKLSGGGLGGNMLALSRQGAATRTTTDDIAAAGGIAAALKAAGATRVITTTVPPGPL